MIIYVWTLTIIILLGIIIRVIELGILDFPIKINKETLVLELLIQLGFLIWGIILIYR